MRGFLAALIVLILATPVYAANFESWIQGHPTGDWVFGEYVIPQDNGVVVIGKLSEVSHPKWRILVMKLDGDGNVVWAKIWRTNGDVELSKAVTDGQNRIYLAGVIEKKGSGKDGFIVVFSPSGQLLWQKGIGTGGNDVLTDMAIGDDGSIYAVGYSRDPKLTEGAVSVAFLLKLNPNGKPLWVKGYENGYYTTFARVATLWNSVFILGRVAIVGETDVARARVWLLKLSGDGNIEFQETMKHREVKELQTFNGGLVGLIGNTLFIMDENGKVRWARRFGLNLYSVSASESGFAVTTNEGELLLLTPQGEPVRGLKMSFYPYTTGERISRAVWTGDNVLGVGDYIPMLRGDNFDRLLVFKLPSKFPYCDMLRPLGKVTFTPVDFNYLGSVNFSVRDVKGILKVFDINGTVDEWVPDGVWIYPWARLEVIPSGIGAIVGLRSKHYSVSFSVDHRTNLTVLPDFYNISVRPSVAGSFKLSEFNRSRLINPGDELVLYVDFERGKAYLKKVNQATPHTSTEGRISSQTGTTSISKTGGETTSKTSGGTAKESKGGICGPAALVILALAPLLFRRGA